MYLVIVMICMCSWVWTSDGGIATFVQKSIIMAILSTLQSHSMSYLWIMAIGKLTVPSSHNVIGATKTFGSGMLGFHPENHAF